MVRHYVLVLLIVCCARLLPAASMELVNKLSRLFASMVVNVHEAKTHLSRLLQRVKGGEEIVIARAGVPVARIVPVELAGAKRKLGIDKGLVWIADDFDAPSQEIEAFFEGRRQRTSKRAKQR